MKEEKIKEHFRKVDPIIFKFIEKIDLTVLKQSKNPSFYFKELCESIINQQLSNKAANTIMGRFNNLFLKKKITPEELLSFPEQKLRDVGLSWQKTRYVRDLAQKIKDKELKINTLNKLDDKSVLEELIKVKGIGPWTAEMFLMFTLGRENIFSYGDLILRKSVQRLYKLKDKASEEEVNKIVNKWTPYKSYGSLALWKSVDG